MITFPVATIVSLAGRFIAESFKYNQTMHWSHRSNNNIGISLYVTKILGGALKQLKQVWVTHRIKWLILRGWGGVYSIIACLSRMTIGHASLARRGVLKRHNLREVCDVNDLCALTPELSLPRYVITGTYLLAHSVPVPLDYCINRSPLAIRTDYHVETRANQTRTINTAVL